MNNGTPVLVEWVKRSARISRFRPPKRVPGDTDIVTHKEARNLVAVGLVKIVGEAEFVVEKIGVVEGLALDEGDEHGSISSDDTLSPYEG